MSLVVEPMLRAAAGTLSTLHRLCFPEDSWDLGSIGQIMRIPGFFGRIGWIQDHPVGFALALALGEEAEILSLGVLPGYRRTGAGRALLASIRLEAQRRGIERVVLEVAVDNTAARALYAACGFTEVGRRRNYYHRAGCFVDALILRVSLMMRSLAN
jgi:[ribosomal protein S18]-alanine N-acetyltransferase